MLTETATFNLGSFLESQRSMDYHQDRSDYFSRTRMPYTVENFELDVEETSENDVVSTRPDVASKGINHPKETLSLENSFTLGKSTSYNGIVNDTDCHVSSDAIL